MTQSTTGLAPVLTPADHDHFLEHGFVVVKRAANADALPAVLEQYEAGRYAGTVGAADYRPVAPRGLSGVYGPRFAAALSELLGEPATLWPEFAGIDMPRKQEPDKAAGWKLDGAHVDDDYPTPMPAAWSIGCFLFLTPVQSRGGAFIHFAGSYRRYRAAMTRSPWALKGESHLPDISGPAAEFLAEPGDLLLFHHLCGHTGSTNVADPRTRHALLSRHATRARLVPGDKPFEQMSTIEKANSTRYLRHRFGEAFELPALAPDAQVTATLSRGWPGEPGGGPLVAAATHHAAGRVWLFFTQAGRASRIHVAANDGWAGWRVEASLDAGADVSQIGLYQRDRAVYLLAGAAAFASEDMTQWRRLDARPLFAAAGGFTTDYGSKAGRGYFVLMLRPGESRITATLAPKLDAALAGGDEVESFAGDGTPLAGFTMAPTYGEGEFALVLDARGVPGPRFVRGKDTVLFKADPRPLAIDAPTPPRHVRVHHRAKNFWIVTYLRAEGGGDRLFWGVVDWDAKTPAITELRDASALRAALATVGVT